MFASLAIATILAVSSQQDRCYIAFDSLYSASTKRANERKFGEAATLREAAGHIYHDCAAAHDAPKYSLYPFDEVAAYVAAGLLWHQAGDSKQAIRNIGLSKTALATLQLKYPKRLRDDHFEIVLSLMERLIRDAESGHWDLWSSVSSARDAKRSLGN